MFLHDLNYDFIVHNNFTHTAASSKVTDDVTN